MKRILTVAALVVAGAVGASAQQTKVVDTTKRNAPATKTVAPPPTKTVTPAGTKQPTAPVTQQQAAPPTTQTKQPTTPTTQTKQPTTPTTQTKQPTTPTTQTKQPATTPTTQAQSKATPPAPQTKAATPPATQTKQPTTPTTPTQTQSKATPPATQQTKAATPPAGQAKAAAPPPAPQTKAVPPAGRGGTALNVVRSDTAAVAAPLVMMREVYEYDRDGRRDPFISLLATTDLRPTLSDLRLLMTVVDEPGRSVALVADSYDKKQKTLRVGTRLGRMRVSSIRTDVVVFTIEEFGMNRRDSLLLRDSTKVRGR